MAGQRRRLRSSVAIHPDSRNLLADEAYSAANCPRSGHRFLELAPIEDRSFGPSRCYRRVDGIIDQSIQQRQCRYQITSLLQSKRCHRRTPDNTSVGFRSSPCTCKPRELSMAVDVLKVEIRNVQDATGLEEAIGHLEQWQFSADIVF